MRKRSNREMELTARKKHNAKMLKMKQTEKRENARANLRGQIETMIETLEAADIWGGTDGCAERLETELGKLPAYL